MTRSFIALPFRSLQPHSNHTCQESALRCFTGFHCFPNGSALWASETEINMRWKIKCPYYIFCLTFAQLSENISSLGVFDFMSGLQKGKKKNSVQHKEEETLVSEPWQILVQRWFRADFSPLPRVALGVLPWGRITDRKLHL